MSKKLAISVVLLLVCISKVFAQEMTAEDAKRIKPFPPVGLILKCVSGNVNVSWRPHALESVSLYGHYVVYRSRNGGRFVKISIVKQDVHFTDKRGRKGDSYALSAVNYYKAESPLSVAVKLKSACR